MTRYVWAVRAIPNAAKAAAYCEFAVWPGKRVPSPLQNLRLQFPHIVDILIHATSPRLVSSSLSILEALSLPASLTSSLTLSRWLRLQLQYAASWPLPQACIGLYFQTWRQLRQQCFLIGVASANALTSLYEIHPVVWVPSCGYVDTRCLE